MGIVVQKYGGSTVASIQKIKDIARQIQMRRQDEEGLVVVISAMGDTTDELLERAHEISASPSPRELDMLLSTGETASMSLLTIALNELGCSAIGLCGYQAGIQTDNFFSNASITEIQNQKITEALDRHQVVVVAGFQGQSATGDLTTLGRGGSDTTAVSLAASLGADRCEILKDVSHIYSADPRAVHSVRPLPILTYDHLLEMTYWGANVLQYRSVEIASHYRVPLFVRCADLNETYTQITQKVEDFDMLESSEILSVNSHEAVLKIEVKALSLAEALAWLKDQLVISKMPYPQILHSEESATRVHLYLTATNEAVKSLSLTLSSEKPVFMKEISSVTATCRGSTRPETVERIIQVLDGAGIHAGNLVVSSMSITVFIERNFRLPAIRLLHQLIPEMAVRP